MSPASHYLPSMCCRTIVSLVIFISITLQSDGFQQPTRRDFFALSTTGASYVAFPSKALTANSAPSLTFSTSKSGIQWADAKPGTGQVLKEGSTASIDYALATTGARYGSKIYSNSDSGAPYRWTLGDGTTIKGIEESILGSEDMPPMKAGGIRRVILPPNLAYESLVKKSEGCGVAGNLGPVPSPSDAFEEFQRFKNIYCNPSRMYQPDVVMDIKLYGKRSLD
mmetsp:Transcript_15739/g.19189  ORF Transcript_15739/g.19189 Transcript_15739/m.19189 type:complete len:224 (+) Transcript_15739:128-799(+)